MKGITMAYSLPSLPYATDALEPFYDKQTVEIHHGKHHQTYVNKLNEAVEKHPELFEKSVEKLIADLASIPEDIRTAVTNHGGGHANHAFFWKCLGPTGGTEAKDEIAEAIHKTFGSITAFQEKFAAQATAVFGSGWTWLVKSKNGLEIVNTSNQASPYNVGQVPLLVIDVWEHAYYLKYQNRRPDWIQAFWKIVNWDAVNGFYKAA